MRKLWLSFADLALPEGHQFLGVVIYPIASWPTDEDEQRFLMREVINQLHSTNLNPGGEIQFTLLPPDDPIPDDMVLKLLSKSQLEEMGLV
jgi:hypothetical protein